MSLEAQSHRAGHRVQRCLCAAAETAKISTVNSQEAVAGTRRVERSPGALRETQRSMSRPRPKYLNLVQIRLPLPGVVSILHRVSGAALFLLLPFLLALFELSLESPRTFGFFKSLASHWSVKLILIGAAWAYFHHLCAGIRHLALDLDYGTELVAARATSWAVLAVSAILTLAVALLLW